MQITMWREILDPYYLAVDEILVKFNHIIESYRKSGSYSPIEEVTGRVKSISSILEKTQRKKIPIDDIESKLDDIAGIRIICQFVEDIDKVVSLIKNRKDMEVKLEKDYVRHPKPSGYRSYHIVVWYTVETIGGTRRIPVEIQVRTLAMNFWATIEHSLQYKYKENMPEEISQRLSNSANAIVTLDAQMSKLRIEIMDAQESYRMKDNTINDILNNLQNLYKVINMREVEKLQDEFYKIYKTEDFMMLDRFSKRLDEISESDKSQSIN